jgi:NAD(P)-dependent dehydrogenase (short-subunit alcohol dehydrogenase family)
MPGTALITGAGRRIGRAIAQDLAGRGWAIGVHYHHSADDAHALVEAIVKGGGKAVALAADLADEDAAEALIPQCSAALGTTSLLINNASLFENDSLATATASSWAAHMAVNLRAPLVLTQGLMAGLGDDGADGADPEMSGNIINMLDQRVWNLSADFLSYTTSKAGLWTLTQTLALACAPRVRVNGIGPGPALASKRQSPAQFEESCQRLPLGRGTTPSEICNAVRFILDSPAMTGQMIALDGGEHLVSTPAP